MNSFPAYFYTGIKPKAIKVLIELQGKGLEFYSDDQKYFWEYSKISPSIGNDSKKIIITFGKNHPQDYIEIIDENAIQYLHQYHANSFFQKNSNVKAIGCFISLILAIIFSILLAYYILLPWMSHKIVKHFPKELESKLGEVTMATYLADKTKIDSGKSALLQEYFNELHINGNETVKIYYFKDSIVNAFAVPGAHIVIYEGLLNKMTSYTQLAALFGHEYAHIAKKHSIYNIAKNISLSSLSSILFGDVTGFGGLILENAQSIKTLEYSREFESEADTEAFKYLTSRNIDPKGILSLFELLESESKKNTVIPQFLSTHPLNSTRIKSIETLLKNHTFTEEKHIKLDSLFIKIIN